MTRQLIISRILKFDPFGRIAPFMTFELPEISIKEEHFTYLSNLSDEELNYLLTELNIYYNI